MRPRAAGSVKVSVVVPCAPRHARLLEPLMALLDRQTSRPNEVVIAGTTTRLAARSFPIRIVATEPRANAARNRNAATSRATGDVICYQDADDVPHTQRIEIVRRLFERFDVEHLMHAFVHAAHPTTAWSTSRYDVGAIDRLARYHPYSFEAGLTNGNPAVRRTLAQAVRWPEGRRIGEDVAFNVAACARSRSNVVLRVPLLLYRQHLSATTS